MNTNKLKGKIVERGLTLKDFADKLNINPSTLTRKLNGEVEFKRDEIMSTIEILGLTPEEVIAIFFAIDLRFRKI